MRVRREVLADADAIRAVHAAAFATPENPGVVPVQAGLVHAQRADPGWRPELSFVAVTSDDTVLGHVVCTEGAIRSTAVLGLGPIGVLPDHQGRQVGHALMHAVLAAADALDEPLVALLGNPAFYSRFGFRSAAEYGITPTEPAWVSAFQVRTLSAYDPALRGEYRFCAAFDGL